MTDKQIVPSMWQNLPQGGPMLMAADKRGNDQCGNPGGTATQSADEIALNSRYTIYPPGLGTGDPGFKSPHPDGEGGLWYVTGTTSIEHHRNVLTP